MTGAMYAAIAGLRTHMQNLNVIGNNVANVNTTAYKSARSVFKTSIYTSLNGGSNGTSTTGGINPSQIGYGSTLATVDIDMSTGNYSVTGNSTDMMLNGDGFFLLGTKDIAMNFTGTSSDVGSSGTFTSLTLTRTGEFNVAADGYLANSDGLCVYGFLCTGLATLQDVMDGKASEVGDPLFSDQLVPIRMPVVYKDNDNAMCVGYPRINGGVQQAVEENEEEGIEAIAGDPAYTDFEAIEKWDGDNYHLLDYGSYLDTMGNVVETTYSRGYFTGITVDQNTGLITGTCGDLGGQQVVIGCIAVGSVTNPNGVTQIGSTYYKASAGSGELTICGMGGAGSEMGVYYVNGSLRNEGENAQMDTAGTIDGARLRSTDTGVLTNGLEMSKTDLAQEIANMILTQRGYQANTRIITVTDSMLEELVNMKR